MKKLTKEQLVVRTIRETFQFKSNIEHYQKKFENLLQWIQLGFPMHLTFRIQYGLCDNCKLSSFFGTKIFPLWPEFSGDTVYPVKGISGKSNATTYFDTDNMYIGTYGKRRIRLLKWLLRHFELAAKPEPKQGDKHVRINSGITKKLVKKKSGDTPK